MNANRLASSFILSLAASLPLIIGCGRGPEIPAVVPVTGTVTYKGEPLAGGLVTLEHVDAKGRSATGTTDDKGQFSVVCYYDPAHSLDGAIPGEYRVGITKSTTTDVPKVADLKGKTPEEIKKISIEQSKNMVAAGTPKAVLPKKYASPANSGLKATVAKGMQPLKFELRD